MPLTPTEKTRIRTALGYPQVDAIGSYNRGIPMPLQTAFLVETSLTQVMEEAIPTVQQYLQNLEAIEAALAKAICNLAVERIGDITMRPGRPGESQPDLLEREYRRWAERLADILGVPLYAYSTRFSRSGVRSGNVRVVH